jgi:acyl-homoserine-lactone acylase
MYRIGRFGLAGGGLLLLGALAAGPRQSALVAGAEILWDSYGVPHIYASSDTALARAFGWAQMEAHAELLLFLYGQARGRAAEYWGREYEELDSWLRRLGVPRMSQQWLHLQDPTFRRYLEAFAAGINSWAGAHRDQIPDSLAVVLPVTAQDVLAHGQRVLVTAFVTNPERIRAVARSWLAGRSSAPNDAESLGGSNGWAIAPARSASGKAILMANPHLPWGGLYTWFEAHLVAPGLDVYGATLVGSPVVTTGFNANLGWTHTVNTYDGEDVYELRLEEGGRAYRWNEGTRSFEVRVETLLVKGAAGVLERRELVIRSSLHGPVVAERGNRALALRVAGLDRPRAWRQWWDMGRASSLEQFRAALAEMQLPMFTVIYADRSGHIMHFYAGLVPRRASGDWAYWQGIVPGDNTATLWTEYHRFEELPQVVDPPSGWVQNANDPPWTTTFPLQLDPARYPSYLAPRGMSLRAQRSVQLLLASERLSATEVMERKHSTRSVLADRVLDDLLATVSSKGDRAPQRGAGILAAWDRQTDATSRGAVLFAFWWREYLRRVGASPFAVPWTAEQPLTTPDGLADPLAALAALDSVTRELEQRYGSADVAWGEVYRLERDSLALPGNGGPGALGIFRVVEYTQPDGRTPGKAVGGDSFVMVVEFGDPVRAWAVLGYGNWSRPGSPHRVDQLPLVAGKSLRPVLLDRAAVEARLERKERL